MATTLLIYVIPLALLVLPTPISALANLTAFQVGAGNCSGYPASFPQGGFSADAFIFTPSQCDNASINDLPTTIAGQPLVVYPDNSSFSTIFQCNGGIILNGFGDTKLLISEDGHELGYWGDGMGVEPETYAHWRGGKRVDDNIYLGYGNVTSWAFRLVPEGYYRIRLFGKQDVFISKGEFKGFLKVGPGFTEAFGGKKLRRKRIL